LTVEKRLKRVRGLRQGPGRPPPPSPRPRRRTASPRSRRAPQEGLLAGRPSCAGRLSAATRPATSPPGAAGHGPVAVRSPRTTGNETPSALASLHLRPAV